MRSFLILVMLVAMLPLNASKIDIQPGSFGVSTDSFAFHSREQTMYMKHGPLSYGRLDLGPLQRLVSDPHGNRLSLDLDCRDSVKRGVRGMLFDSGFLDFTAGLGNYPESSVDITYQNMDLAFDFKHGRALRKSLLSPWDKVLEKDIITLGIEAREEHGLSTLALFSLSPSISTRVFTGLSLDTESLTLKIGRGNTMASSKDTESSIYLRGMNDNGYIFISDRTGRASYRPSSYTETTRELGYGFKFGKVEVGSVSKVDFTHDGKWRRKVSRYLDLGYAKFTFTDGRMKFSMDRVEGFSIGLSGRNTSISFRHKGLEVKRYYDGSWSFSLSIEPTKE